MAEVLRHGPRTLEEVRQATGLPARTLRYARAALRHAKRLEERRSLRDARRKILFLRDRAAERRREEAQASPQLTQ